MQNMTEAKSIDLVVELHTMAGVVLIDFDLVALICLLLIVVTYI